MDETPENPTHAHEVMRSWARVVAIAGAILLCFLLYRFGSAVWLHVQRGGRIWRNRRGYGWHGGQHSYARIDPALYEFENDIDDDDDQELEGEGYRDADVSSIPQTPKPELQKPLPDKPLPPLPLSGQMDAD